ncbi:MAG TPA: hypothetical protein PK543_00055 [Candidatus Saccharibacteria bacterium]|nr:hypothetical protein [Candidatus Saccharibacteria bacterium]
MISNYLSKFYEETLLDLSVFLEMNPESETEFVYYLPLFQRTNEQLLNPDIELGESLALAKVRNVIDVKREDYPPLSNDPFSTNSSGVKAYKIKVNSEILRKELSILDSPDKVRTSNNRIEIRLLKEGSTLRLTSELGDKVIHTFRNGLVKDRFIDHVVAMSPNKIVSRKDLERRGVTPNEPLDELLRRSGFNSILKKYFVKVGSSNEVHVQDRIYVDLAIAKKIYKNS